MASSPSEASELEFAFPPSGIFEPDPSGSRSSDEFVDGEWTKVRCQVVSILALPMPTKKSLSIGGALFHFPSRFHLTDALLVFLHAVLALLLQT